MYVVQLGNAKTFGFATDLNLTGNKFGNLTTVVSVILIVFEVPWVLAIRRFGANPTLGVGLILWSAVTLATAFVKTYNQALAVRTLLRVFEAGISPGFAYLFSTI